MKPKASDIANSICQRYHRTLNPQALEVLLKKRTDDNQPAVGNPLWLQMAVEEINLLDADDFERAEKSFSGSPEEKLYQLLLTTVEELPSTVSDLYGRLLNRAEQLHGQSLTQGFVNLIAISRSGWREKDFENILPQITNETWDPLKFAALRRTFRSHITQKGAEAQWNFAHAQLRLALLDKDKDEEKKWQQLHELMADHLESLVTDDKLRLTELMWHLMHSGNLLRTARYYACMLSSVELDAAKSAVLSYIMAEQIDNANFQRTWVKSLLCQMELKESEISVLGWRIGDIVGSYENSYRDFAFSLWAYQLALTCRENLISTSDHPHQDSLEKVIDKNTDEVQVVQVTDEILQDHAEVRDRFDHPRGPSLLRVHIKDGYFELWDQAYQLYKNDQESEALTVLVDTLQLPSGVQERIEHIRRLLGKVDTSSLDVRQVHPLFLQQQANSSNPGLILVPQFLILMGMSLSPVLGYAPNKCEAAIIDLAKDYVEIVLNLFPGSPTLITLAGQVNCCLGKFDSADTLCKKALLLDPDYEVARRTLEIIQRRRIEGVGT